jgi:predicted ATPase
MSALIASHHLQRVARYVKSHNADLAHAELQNAHAALKHVSPLDPERHDLVTRFYALVDAVNMMKE